MKAPAFWTRPPSSPGALSTALSPLGRLYAAATARRVAQAPSFAPPIPTICVGNLNAGGTGKTPVCIAVAQMLLTAGHRPHVVSRGYGGTQQGPLQVTPKHKAQDVGDEPLLLAAFAPTWIAKDRAAGGRAATQAGASHLILDDGFQNPSLTKSLSIVVVDAARGFGNGRCIPAGPLREPVAAGLARADVLISIGNETDQTRFAAAWGHALTPDQAPRLTNLSARLEPLQTGYSFQNQRVLAFAGIGHPDKFFATLEDLGAKIVDCVPLGDHQPLTPALMARLERDAALKTAQLVTTEKDAVRLPDNFRHKVITVPVRLHLDAPEKLSDALTALK